MNKKKTFSSVIIWQMVSKFSVQGINIITTPIFTRLMTAAEYGKFTNYNAWLVVVNIVVGLQTQGSIANARIKYNEEEYNRYLSSIYSISFLAYILGIMGSIILKGPIAQFCSIDSRLVPVMLVNSFFSFTTSFYSEKLIQERAVKKNAILSSLIALMTAGFSVVFVKQMNSERYVGRIYGSMIPITIIGFFEIILLYKKGKLFIERFYWRYCLTLTLPLIFHGISGTILSLSDRMMITKIVGDEATGIYGVAYGLTAMLNTIWMAFNSSWIPFYYEFRKENQFEEIKKRSNNYMYVFTVITCGFILCMPEAFKIMTPENYWSGLRLLPLIVLAYYFCFLYSFQVNFEFYYEKTKLISIGTLLAAVINLLFNCWLIPRWHDLGAAIATALSYFLSFLFHYINAKYIMKEKYEHKMSFLLKGLLPVIVLSGMYYYIMNYWIFRWITAGILGVMLFCRFIVNKEII